MNRNALSKLLEIGLLVPLIIKQYWQHILREYVEILILIVSVVKLSAEE